MFEIYLDGLFVNCFQGSLVPTHSRHIFFFFFPMEKEIMVDKEKAKDLVSLDFRRAFENVLKILGENKGIGAGLAHSEKNCY